MQRLLRAFLAAMTAILLLPASAQGDPPLVLRGLDPVHLVEGREVAGKVEFAATHGRFRYQFESRETLARFNAEPERFAVANDGACGAMPEAQGSPDLFAVHSGKIYLFGSPGCRETFLASPGVFTGEVKRRQVAILVYQGVELLDFAGPGEVFASAASGAGFEVFTVGASRDPVVSQGFVTVTPEYAIADAPAPNILVVPGGGVRALLSNPQMMSWLKASAAKAEIVLSVCNGALVLAETGLLDGLSATTHHGSLAALRREAQLTKVVEGVRFVDNGKIVTAAGVSAGIDAALHVVERLLGAEQAAVTARYMEYDRSARAGAAAAGLDASMRP